MAQKYFDANIKCRATNQHTSIYNFELQMIGRYPATDIDFDISQIINLSAY
jgi:hypothetical protein